MPIPTKASFCCEILGDHLRFIKLIRMLIRKSLDLCISKFESEILATDHLTDGQRQLNWHYTFKYIVKYVRWETSNGMKMLQTLAKSTLTFNTKVTCIFSLHSILHMNIMTGLCSHVKLCFGNFSGLDLVCSTATESADISRVPIRRLHPSKGAFEDRIRHSGASSAVPFRRVLRMRPRYAAFVSRI